MAARFELAIDLATFAAARRMAPEIRAVSAERIAEELRKILTNRHRARGFRLLREFELVPQVLPELADGPACDRLVRVLEVFPSAVSFPLAFAAAVQSLAPEAAEEV